MKAYTNKDLENPITRDEFRYRNTHTINGYRLFMYRVRYSKDGNIYKKCSLDYDNGKIELYFHDQFLGDQKSECELRIQTTSWGALNYEEMKKKMSLYQQALDTVEWFNKFDWEITDIYEDYN